MKKKVCYKLDSLLRLIPDFHLDKILTIEESEDWSKKNHYAYFVGEQPIKYVYIYYSLWTSMTVYTEDGEKIKILPNNVNSNDLEALRIVKNDIISPRLTINDNYIEVTEKLHEWLNNQGISDKVLETIIETFEVYSIIEFPGVCTPSKHGSSWGYSSENLKLDEREIKTVLDGIEDELLREKIKCIFYARVFKQRY